MTNRSISAFLNSSLPRSALSKAPPTYATLRQTATTNPQTESFSPVFRRLSLVFPVPCFSQQNFPYAPRHKMHETPHGRGSGLKLAPFVSASCFFPITRSTSTQSCETSTFKIRSCCVWTNRPNI